MYIGQYTVNVESGIKEDAASISGSVSETMTRLLVVSLPMPDIGAILHAGELHLHAGWQRGAAIIRYPGHITSSF